MNTKDKKEFRCVSRLANAIVKQACEDYRMAIRGRGNSPRKMIKDVVSFFESEWYKQLTMVNPVYLRTKLDKEWEEGQKLIEAGSKVECSELKKPYEFECPLCGGTAETKTIRFKTKKRKDGSYKITYYQLFTCECHKIPEQVLLKQEVITNENNQD